MNLFLYNQKRDRDLDEYLNKLHINSEAYSLLNQRGKKLLLVGGGYSLLKPQFKMQTVMDIINIDLDPPNYSPSAQLQNIKGDFTENVGYINEFDEIWALYSLPLYAPSEKSVYMFVLKSILAIKDTGVIRFFPLEYESSNKMHTKDADYDMTTMECTNSVLDVIKVVNRIGVNCTQEIVNMRDENRKETVITLFVDLQNAKKEDINSFVLKKIDEYNSKYKNDIKINIFTGNKRLQI